MRRELRDYGSRVVPLNGADPALSGRVAGEPFGELLAPGAALGTGARVGRMGRALGLLDDLPNVALKVESPV